MRQKGFTLIEIIAVLVILGILAAVALPKYADLQQESRNKAVEGAIASFVSTVTMEYSRGLLTGSWADAANYSPSESPITLGDYAGTIANAGGNITVTVAWATTTANINVANVDSDSKIKTFALQ